MNAPQQIQGVVDKVLFSNHASGFAVLSIESGGQKTTVTGHLPTVQPGQYVTITGVWILHPKFGKQFEAHACNIATPTSITGLKKYLGSGLIKGIGPAYADKLVDHFGISVLDIIDQHPERLTAVPGIGPKRIEQIQTAWKGQKELSQVMVFLQDKDISPALAIKIYKRYGAESIARISQNPYRVADEVWGIGFKTADQIAQKLGFSLDCAPRIAAGIVYTISQHLASGSLYIPLDELKETAIELLSLDSAHDHPKIKYALHELYAQEAISLLSVSDNHYITLSKYYWSEKGVAHKLLSLLERPSDYQFDIDAIYSAARTSSDRIDLNDDQIRGILTCLQHKITIITGGPGTGKTTLIKRLITILEQYKRTYKLTAPTGRAAKRMQEGTGRIAMTIHRLLEFDVSSMSFTRNEKNCLSVDFLIIDEASMIDVFLAHALLKALPTYAHIIFIGDIDQLPSVGPGNILNDMISSNKIPCIRLTHIFRQAQDSMIIHNAHRVNRGEFPTTHQEGARRDFIYIKQQDPTEIEQQLQAIFKHTLPAYKIPTEAAIVLTPMNRTHVGTYVLNGLLQNMLNHTHATPELTYGSITFKINDRVMQIRNNYDKFVFNGDIGTISAIDLEEQQVTVTFFDHPVVYETSELDELTLAYAITVHKSQGSEYAAVIIPLFMQHFTLLQRNLLYTAITRAKKLCILIGQPKAIGMAIKNTKGTTRITFLHQYLTSDLQCR